ALAAILSSASLSAQTSITSSVDYGVLVLNDGVSDIKDSAISGDILYSDNSQNVIEDISPLTGSVFVHTNVDKFDAKPVYAPTGGTFTSGFDDKIDQANIDAMAMAMLADTQTATASYGKIDKTDFSYSSSSSLTVLDIEELIQDENTFSLTGRAGEDDQFIIRIDKKLNFRKSLVELNNLDASDVLWYFGTGGDTDIFHAKPDPDADYGFSGVVLNPDGQIRLGGEGDFNGTLIGGEIKIGSGANFESIPEPSSSALILLGSMALLARRRRS
ncbi:MAG: PEP-CTERM sorting domain-containing protein, partial [Verrucomicrobiae bacterium]|nr:PEP-CTERM sorting domain-containing protein [Verrucomicrobiae bacterium]NNJ86707.1 PEP-CTERM sorting domain-containing protein [Akkermansiaceae bacterium]